MMVIVDAVLEQVPADVMLHCKTFVPSVRPVTVELGLVDEVITPPPVNTDQVPVPVVGVLAANVAFGELIQTVWFDPALAILVAGSTIIVIVLVVDEQVPALVIVHSKTLVPKLKFVTVEFGASELVIIPVPLMTDQVPVPVVGVLAASVAFGELIQTVWFDPALAMLVAGSTIIVIVLVVDEQVPADVMLHCKTFVPSVRPVTVELGLVEEVITPPPVNTLQVPIPVVGVLAASVAFGELIQTVWFDPALAMLVAGSTIIVIVDVVLEQVPALVIVHSNILVPKLKFVTVEFGASELVIIPVPLMTDHVPVPVVGVLAASVAFGELIQTV